MPKLPEKIRRHRRHFGLFNHLSSTRSHILVFGFAFLYTLMLFTGSSVAGPVRQDERTTVYYLEFDGAVTPILESYLDRALSTAIENGAEAVILQLDTPGGSVDVTKSITQQMLASPIPIVVYVAPSGARAGSAGTFLTLSGHVAAMAPGTSIGAASPVGATGEDVGETMEEKIKNILSADIENLAERRGEKAVEWAIAAVQDAEAATAREALELGVIDFIAVDRQDLMQQLDGFSVQVNGGALKMNTASAQLLPLPLSLVEEFLNFIANPSVASILLSLGVLGLIVEIRTPGFGIPGILGSISLLIAFYSLGLLDANFAGLVLIAAALALLVAEAFTPTFGVLAVGGALAFVLGAALLFNASGLAVPWITIVSLALLLGGFAVFAGAKALGAQRNPVVTGGEALIGQIATVKTSFAAGEEGRVFVAGEWWNARLLSGSVQKGERARIVRREGFVLTVEKLATGP